jgi:hypothetical protein
MVAPLHWRLRHSCVADGATVKSRRSEGRGKNRMARMLSMRDCSLPSAIATSSILDWIKRKMKKNERVCG